jgi:hypothetical protein
MLPLAMCVGAALLHPAAAGVPGLDGRGVPADSDCPATSNIARILHSDKIVFAITGQLQAAIAADQAALDKLPRNLELDIKVRDNPKRIADLRSKVLSFIGAAFTPGHPNFGNIAIRDVEYAAVVCPKSP